MWDMRVEIDDYEEYYKSWFCVFCMMWNLILNVNMFSFDFVKVFFNFIEVCEFL